MRKIKWPLLALTALLILGGVAVVCLPNPGRNVRVTEKEFAQLHEGMTLAEVEAILGGPPDNYVGAFTPRYEDALVRLPSSRPAYDAPDDATLFFFRLEVPHEQPAGLWWVAVIPGSEALDPSDCAAAAIWLRFDEAGKVTDGSYLQVFGRRPPSFFVRCKDWLSELLDL